MLTVVCAWCGKVLRGLIGQGPISHGACRRCTRAMLVEAGLKNDWSLWQDLGGEG